MTARHRSGVAVTTRLIALIMLPVTAMCLLAGSVVFSRLSTATQARIVDHGVVGLSELVALRDALHAQQSSAEFDVRFLQVGVTRAVASAYIGFDWSALIPPARTEASRAIASLGVASPVSAVALQALYADIDAAVISPTVAVQRLGAYLAVAGTAVERGLSQLEAKAEGSSLLAALESLQEQPG